MCKGFFGGLPQGATVDCRIAELETFTYVSIVLFVFFRIVKELNLFCGLFAD
ncbi:MAG: hypothetical protein JWM81_134 [Candidatus Saccharibacteria bacterium]|nr:hypothetical protein [Candidatus Saccharibacteria bacterium]